MYFGITNKFQKKILPVIKYINRRGLYFKIFLSGSSSEVTNDICILLQIKIFCSRFNLTENPSQIPHNDLSTQQSLSSPHPGSSTSSFSFLPAVPWFSYPQPQPSDCSVYLTAQLLQSFFILTRMLFPVYYTKELLLMSYKIFLEGCLTQKCQKCS